MNRNNLKKYAPEARRDFIRAVTDRASYYGLTAKKAEPVTIQGDIALISGRAFPKKLADQRKQLEDRIKRQGFDQVMEAMAYTWFNRLVAIRFMELHGYLDHGYRVLSHPEGGTTPEIVEHAEHVDLPGLDKEKVVCLKLEGTKEAELYRMLLIAQCNALHSAMPFLFERIDDETELLLPDNLLHSDSLVRTLVNEILEEDWQEVEIIGWLYQFYISEKKDEVIGKVVASEDIPAATQLFTPNWIVKYLVQNSLGRQWMATYPNSPLRAQMEFYIEPAEQTPEVQEQLKAITPETLNPEELTLLDPACGSGHILVEAYDLLKAIYQERGYRAKDIPRLILEKNLFGLEIDDRAAQLAAFALMMKARADDRRIFDGGIEPHVVAIQESTGLDAREITEALNQPILKVKLPPSAELFEEIADEKSPLFSRKHLGASGDVAQADVARLLGLFEHGRTFGSLIQVPVNLAKQLPAICQRVADVLTQGGMFEQVAAKLLKPLVEQARILAGTFSAVTMNPPYMGNKGMNDLLRSFASDVFPEAKYDLYSMFIMRGTSFLSTMGRLGMVTMHSWMFLGSFRNLREALLSSVTLQSMAHLGPRAFSTISGEVVQVTAFSCMNAVVGGYIPTFFRLLDGDESEKQRGLAGGDNRFASSTQDQIRAIPDSPIAYWLSPRLREQFAHGTRLSDVADPRAGLQTSDNDRFLRLWHEVDLTRTGFGCVSRAVAKQSHKKWFPCTKGGSFRRWYGNNQYVVNWENDGEELFAFAASLYGSPTRIIKNASEYFREGITWSSIASSFSMRHAPAGYIFETKGSMCFPHAPDDLLPLLGFSNTKLVEYMLAVFSPTLDFHEGPFGKLPLILPKAKDRIAQLARKAVALAHADWDSHEHSWDFAHLPMCDEGVTRPTVAESYEQWATKCADAIQSLITIETEINAAFIEAYGVQGELSPEVPEDQITLYRPDREEDIKRLLSYAIGCMMGRYSLDKPGLIYAHSGGTGFDPGQYQTFPADEDGIIPLTESEWFEDDAANRLERFIATAWPKEHLEENLKFIAESLGPNRGERPRETIRRYLVLLRKIDLA